MRSLLLLSALLVACPPVEPEPPVEDPCADSAPGTVHVLATGFSGTEGIAFSPDGRLFVSDGDDIAEVQPDGSWQVIAQVPDSIGLAWWGERLLVASSDSGLGDGQDGVFRVDVDTGAVALIGQGIPGANFVTVTPWDTLLVTDPGADGILEMTADGDVSPWSDQPISPNGTAFTPDDDILWAVTTFNNPAPAWRIAVEDGSAGAVEQVVDFPTATAPDGVAVGADGSLYIAQNVAGRVDRVLADGTVQEVADEVEWAASIAFGDGEGWDACSVYATSLFGPDLYRVEVGARGLPPHR